jgi:ssDNA-binding Zn-finger/Zn-ribbon topoisomerase 1
VTDQFADYLASFRAELATLEQKADGLRNVIVALAAIVGEAAHPPQIRKASMTIDTSTRTQPHRQFQGKAPRPGQHTCPQCGRGELRKATGQAGARGLMTFHFARGCELPCYGGPLSKLTEEDLKGGVHRLKQCPVCDKKRVSYK